MYHGAGVGRNFAPPLVPEATPAPAVTSPAIRAPARYVGGMHSHICTFIAIVSKILMLVMLEWLGYGSTPQRACTTPFAPCPPRS